MQRITPCLWFNDNAETAVKFYASIFKNSKINTVTHYGEAGACASGRPVGTVMTIAFQLEGQDFLALNGGPHFTFSPAISLVVTCKTQREIDDLWRKLGAGGRIDQCGWLQDKFGLSWQIVPSDIGKTVQGSRDRQSRSRDESRSWDEEDRRGLAEASRAMSRAAPGIRARGPRGRNACTGDEQPGRVGRQSRSTDRRSPRSPSRGRGGCGRRPSPQGTRADHRRSVHRDQGVEHSRCTLPRSLDGLQRNANPCFSPERLASESSVLPRPAVSEHGIQDGE